MKAAIILVVVLGIAACVAGKGKKWALLITGASTSTRYEDYSLLSAINHAYHSFSDHGIPDEQIVVMSSDDLAFHYLNPFPGNVVNYPYGRNLYPGSYTDYTKREITVDVFLAVLQGDSERVYDLIGRHGKVIDSGPEDTVFVFFASHGNVGILLMPNGNTLYASELNEALQSMYDNKRYDKLVFYLEACYAGSMFEDLLPNNIDIYALSSANPYECAYGCYYDESRDAWVGGYFASSWLENCDLADLTNETLQQQYKVIVERVYYSNPTQWGDLSITELPVSTFLGDGRPRLRLAAPSFNVDSDSAVPLDKLEVFTLNQLLADPKHKSRHEEIRAKLDETLWLQAQADVFFSDLAAAASIPHKDAEWLLNTQSSIKQRSAYEYTVQHLMNVCPRLRSANMGKLNVLVNLTNRLPLKQVLAALDTVANSAPVCV